MIPDTREQRARGGGPATARRLAVVCAVLFVIGTGAMAADVSQTGTTVNVTERDGGYLVAAAFTVPQPPAVAHAVLTDFAGIPRFMPEVRTSKVLERDGGRIVVEQEAIARFMMFSKRVHLVLDVQQQPGRVQFTDRCGQSFSRYQGTWTIEERAGDTKITYELAAQPSFDVPAFVLRRLFKRDASQMIERLKAEIAARARPDRTFDR